MCECLDHVDVICKYNVVIIFNNLCLIQVSSGFSICMVHLHRNQGRQHAP